jgi:ABC-2 type transport system permease protein
MSALAMAGASLRRLSRDRTAMFFMVVMPVFVILVIGTVSAQPDRFRVGLVAPAASAEGDELGRALDAAPGLKVHRSEDLDTARTALRRGELSTVVAVPAGIDDDLRASRPVEVTVFVDRNDSTQRAAAQAVSAVVAERAARLAAVQAYQAQSGATFEAGMQAVLALEPTVAPVGVRATVVDGRSDYLPDGFGYSAPTMLILFVFITSLTGGAAMIESRRLGIHDRMLAAPVTTGTIVAGESLSYLAVALIQSAIIIGVGATVFGVGWGDPLAAGALVAVWALVGTGTGMLAGTLFRTPEQATAIGTTAGIAAGMLGGCMWPLEIVPAAMRAFGHIVPHAWAVDGWIRILSHDAGLRGVLPQVAVLAGFATVLLTASIRLRVRLTA